MTKENLKSMCDEIINALNLNEFIPEKIKSWSYFDEFICQVLKKYGDQFEISTDRLLSIRQYLDNLITAVQNRK